MKKIHVAISVKSLSKSVENYNKIFGMEPTVTVRGIYALWRTDVINFAITQNKEAAGTLKHLGFENSEEEEVSKSSNVNKIVWERFSADPQLQLVTNFYGNNSKIRIH